MKPVTWSSIVAVLLVVACSTPGPPKPSSSRNRVIAAVTASAFTFKGASGAGALGVALAAGGTATAIVSNTKSVSALLFSTGQRYEVLIDGHKTATGATENCRCWKDVVLASGLTDGSHVVTLGNSGLPHIIVHSWTLDPGGSLRQRVALTDLPASSLAGGESVSFYVQGASSIVMYSKASSASFDVAINGRPDAHAFSTTGRTGSVRGLVPTTIAWGMPRGLERITVTVRSGTLDIVHVALFHGSGATSLQVIPDEQAARSPELVVYGDSVADGEDSLGFDHNADGFADRLAALRGWRLSAIAIPGAAAPCFGVSNVTDVVNAHPDLVIVSFGGSDMAPGPGDPACKSSLTTYKSAMASIIDELKLGLPAVPIYLQAILPSPRYKDDVRQQWNEALDALAAAHGATFVDPSQELKPGFDYSTLPNNRGHAKIADYWNQLLPSV
jgi:lysophospholipase L1-like esterase